MSETVLERIVTCVRGAMAYDPNVREALVALLWSDEGAQCSLADPSAGWSEGELEGVDLIQIQYRPSDDSESNRATSAGEADDLRY